MDLHPIVSKNTAIGLLYLGEPPVLTRAQVATATGDEAVLLLREAASLPVGARVILELPLKEDPRVLAQVMRNDGESVTVSFRRSVAPERREFPRFRGWVQIRARLGDASQAEAWLAGAEVLAVEHSPYPDVEVSASGLAFDDRPWAHPNELLLLSLGIPRERGVVRAVSRVVHVRPLKETERTLGSEATHRIAVAIDPRCSDALGALARYTLSVQRAFIDGAPRRERRRATP